MKKTHKFQNSCFYPVNFSEPKEINTKLENINTNYNIYKSSFVITD